MGILNRPSDGLLGVLVVLHRSLATYGPMEQARLFALCAPAGLGNFTTGSGPREDQVRKTLLRWTQIGLFEKMDQIVRLAQDTTWDIKPGELARNARRLVLSQENNVSFGNGVSNAAEDFTFAIAWALAQDVYRFPGSSWQEVEQLSISQRLTDGHPVFQNDTRWVGFRDWAPFLGFGWTWSQGGTLWLEIDPTEAVRDALPAVFDGEAELGQETFLRRLAQHVPVVDGGVYRQLVEGRLTGPWPKPEPRELSTSLSRAVLRLQVSRRLRLEDRSDAPRALLIGRNGRQLRAFSHVVIGTEKETATDA